MATAKSVVVDSLPDAGRIYVYDGPLKSFESSGKVVTRGEEITLTGEQVKHAVRYGSRFLTKAGDTIRTQAQIDALGQTTGDRLATGADTGAVGGGGVMGGIPTP